MGPVAWPSFWIAAYTAAITVLYVRGAMFTLTYLGQVNAFDLVFVWSTIITASFLLLQGLLTAVKMLRAAIRS